MPGLTERDYDHFDQWTPTTSVVVIDNIVGRDGTDRLINVERLQFDDVVELVDPEY